MVMIIHYDYSSALSCVSMVKGKLALVCFHFSCCCWDCIHPYMVKFFLLLS